MLRELKMLAGSPVTAIDGNIGRIRTFLFDDRSWKVRYAVVEVSHWMHRRDVVLAVSAMDTPDWTARACHVRMTKQQVSDSPNIDTEMPVSLQQHIAMQEYFGRFACWVDHELGMSSLPTGVRYPVHGKEDPHLRSTEDLHGYEVWPTDGNMGRLEGFVLDESSWHVGYLDVRTGGWLDEQNELLPTQGVERVSWAERRIYLHRAGETGALEQAILPAQPPSV